MSTFGTNGLRREFHSGLFSMSERHERTARDCAKYQPAGGRFEIQCSFPPRGTNFSRPSLSPRLGKCEMGQLHQLVSAGLAIIFSAVMFVTSHLLIEARSAKHLVTGGG